MGNAPPPEPRFVATLISKTTQAVKGITSLLKQVEGQTSLDLYAVCDGTQVGGCCPIMRLEGDKPEIELVRKASEKCGLDVHFVLSAEQSLDLHWMPLIDEAFDVQFAGRLQLRRGRSDLIYDEDIGPCDFIGEDLLIPMLQEGRSVYNAASSPSIAQVEPKGLEVEGRLLDLRGKVLHRKEQRVFETALVVIEPLSLYFSGGQMPIDGAAKILNPLNSLIEHVPLVFATQVFYPKKEGDERLPKQGSRGAVFEQTLHTHLFDGVFRFGMHDEGQVHSFLIDSKTQSTTRLCLALQQRDVQTLLLCGIEVEGRLQKMAREALDLGFSVQLIQDAIVGAKDEEFGGCPTCLSEDVLRMPLS